MHESRVINALVGVLKFLQILDSPVVSLSTIAIDVLPILGPLLCILKVTLNGVEGSNDLLIFLKLVHAGIELFIFWSLDEGNEVLFRFTVWFFLIFLLFLFKLD